MLGLWPAACAIGLWGLVKAWVVDLSGVVRSAADRVATARLRLYAQCSAATVRRGDGWLALETGVSSNDMNGVISEPGADVSGDLVAELIDWFRERGLPSSWAIMGDDAALSAMLVEHGAVPERSGWVSGRTSDAELLELSGPADVDVVDVRTEGALDEWLDVADRCGWIVDEADREARRRLYLAVGLEHAQLWHSVAVRDGVPIGMASAFWNGAGIVELCNLGVVASEQRRGVATALASARIRAARQLGGWVVVAELSPDGWELYRRAGFISVPVRPERWFYLPTHATVSS